MSVPFYYQLIGGTGAFLILLGFYRTSVGKWTSRSFWYELDNLVGACLLITYQIKLHAYVGLIINIVWVLVSFRGLTSFAQRQRKQKRHK